jgi:membrane protein CcdC involved in cytochrome C biogenesis
VRGVARARRRIGREDTAALPACAAPPGRLDSKFVPEIALPTWFHAHLAPLVSSIVGALAVLAWRVRETQRPVSTRSIVLPPLMMGSGFLMFVRPEFRVPWQWAASAFVVGALVLYYPLLRTSRLAREGETIVMHRSRAFLLILLGLVAVRLALRDYVGQLLPVTQTAAVFFILAFGMIVRWRAWMLAEYRRLTVAPDLADAARAAE